MKVSFVLPSRNYNIVLSREELQHLIETGCTGCFRPDRIPGYFRDEHGVKQEGVYHALRYTDKNGEESVQFITINVEKEASSDGGA